VERIENSAKKRAKDAKSRETFEKVPFSKQIKLEYTISIVQVFPELRKQREDKERFNRVGSRIKSDADMEEIMDGLQEQEVCSHS
jgi:nuclear receptor co-repressor 1